MPFVPELAPDFQLERRLHIVIHPKGVVLRRSDAGIVFPDAAELGLVEAEGHRIGSLDGADVVVHPTTREVAPPYEIVGLRMLAALLDRERFAIVGRAMHTCDWLTTSRFCGRCGTATKRVPHERAMACPSCGLVVYPRISPAIITLVRKGDLALLASNAKFPGAFYSTLAGFAEMGESLEQTLAREVKEEVGVEVTNIRYFGSQPWPFPNSLMIAFTADWAAGEIVIDPKEISDAKWFSADALPPVPPSISIARQLIDGWLDAVRGGAPR